VSDDDELDPALAVGQVKQLASEAARATKAEYAIVVIVKGGDIVLGAWCPDVETICQTLRHALSKMDAGDAIHLTAGPAS
jgi:hypothetical protein